MISCGEIGRIVLQYGINHTGYAPGETIHIKLRLQSTSEYEKPSEHISYIKIVLCRMITCTVRGLMQTVDIKQDLMHFGDVDLTMGLHGKFMEKFLRLPDSTPSHPLPPTFDGSYGFDYADNG